MGSQKKEPNPRNLEIGKRIHEIRKCHDITQEDLAVMLGISLRHMANIETGTRGLTLDNAEKLAEILDKTLDYIYCGKTRSVDMRPICQLVNDTLEHIKDEEQKELYVNTIVNLSNMMLKL